MTLKAAMQQIKRNIVYPNLQSAMRPAEHSENLPVSKPSDQQMQSSSNAHEHSVANTWSPMIQKVRINQYLFSQKAPNDLCRDLYLTKENSEFLASSLQERNLLEKKVKITLRRKRTLFTMKDNVCFCNDITELFEQLEIPYDKTS